MTAHPPAEDSAQCCILLRIEVFCCNNYGKMSDLEGETRKQLNANTEVLHHLFALFTMWVTATPPDPVPCLVP